MPEPSPPPFVQPEPTPAQVQALRGPAVIEFGTGWCGWCRAAQPGIAAARAAHPQLPHLRIEDGRGRPLGRAYRVKLWPTLVFLRDGQEVERLVRPDAAAVRAAFDRLAGIGP